MPALPGCAPRFWATKEKAPRQTSARLRFSRGRLAVFNVEQVTLNRHVRIIEKTKSKKPALNSAGSLISLAV